MAARLPRVQPAAEGDSVLPPRVDQDERRTGAGVLGRSGAVEDGLFTRGDAPSSFGGGQLNVVERNEHRAGGALLPVGGLASYVDQHGAPGGDGFEGGLNVDPWRFAIGGGSGSGLTEANAAS